jgi:hypothetical protein
LVFASLLTVWSVLAAAAALFAELRVVVGGEAIDGWTVLGVAQILFGFIGMAGAWFCLGRRTYRWATLFLVMQLPISIVIEANRCDVAPFCRVTDWMRLPQPFFAWRIPVRSQSSDKDLCCATPMPPAPHLVQQPKIYPAGARLPVDFLQQATKRDLGGHSSCFSAAMDDAPCDAYVLHLLSTDSPDVLLVAPSDRTDHQIAAEMFSRRTDGTWAKSGEFVVTCPDSIKALQRGVLTFATPRARDVVLSGRQFNLLLDPTFDCSRPGEASGGK